MSKTKTKQPRAEYADVVLEPVWHCPECGQRNVADSIVKQYDELICRQCDWHGAAGSVWDGKECDW